MVAGLIAPVNESVFEHMKLAFFPTFIWWAISYFVLKRKYALDREKWLISAVASSLISTFFILCFYYTYTGAFGTHSLILDIASLPLGAILGQIAARRIYLHSKTKAIHFYLAVVAFVALFLCFIIFTFRPPGLPLFQEPSD